MTEKLTRRESFKALLALPVIALLGIPEEPEVDEFSQWRVATSKLIVYHDKVLYKHDQAIGYLFSKHPPPVRIDPFENKTT